MKSPAQRAKRGGGEWTKGMPRPMRWGMQPFRTAYTRMLGNTHRPNSLVKSLTRP